MPSKNPFTRWLATREAEQERIREAEENAKHHVDTSAAGSDGHATTQTPPPDPNASVANVIAEDEKTEIVRIRNTVVDSDAVTDTGKAATDGGGSSNATGTLIRPEQTEIIPGRGLPHTLVDHDAVTDTGPASTDVAVPGTGEGTAIIPGRGLPHTLVDHDAITDTGKAADAGGSTTGTTSAEIKAEADAFEHGFTSEVQRLEQAVLDGNPILPTLTSAEALPTGAPPLTPGQEIASKIGEGVARSVGGSLLPGGVIVGGAVGGGAVGGFATVEAIVGAGVLAGGAIAGGAAFAGAASNLVDHLAAGDKGAKDDSGDDTRATPFNPFSGNDDDSGGGSGADNSGSNSGGNAGNDSDNPPPENQGGAGSGADGGAGGSDPAPGASGDGTGGEDFDNQNSTNPDPSAGDGSTLGQPANSGGSDAGTGSAADPAPGGTSPAPGATDDGGAAPATQGEDVDNQQSVGPDPNDTRDQSLGQPENSGSNQQDGGTPGGDGSGGEDGDKQQSVEPDPTDPNGQSVGQVDNGTSSDGSSSDDDQPSTEPATNTDSSAQQSSNDAGGGVAMEGDPGNPDGPDGDRPPPMDAFDRALAGIGIITGGGNHNVAGPDTNPDADPTGGGSTGGTVFNGTLAHLGGNTGDPGTIDSEATHPVGGDVGSILPGHHSGEPGDAQSGIVQDDGLATRGHAKDDGPGTVQFGPSGGPLASPPHSSPAPTTGSGDASGNGNAVSPVSTATTVGRHFDVPTPHQPAHDPLPVGSHYALGAPADSDSSDSHSSSSGSSDQDTSDQSSTAAQTAEPLFREPFEVPHHLLVTSDDD